MQDNNDVQYLDWVLVYCGFPQPVLFDDGIILNILSSTAMTPFCIGDHYNSDVTWRGDKRVAYNNTCRLFVLYKICCK